MKKVKKVYDQKKFKNDNCTYKKVYTPNESIKLAKEFLTELGPKYIDSFTKCEEENTFSTVTYNFCIKNNIIPMSHSYYGEDKKSHINLLAYFDATDTYTLIHEVVHVTNQYKKPLYRNDVVDDNEYQYYTWNLFTEALSDLACHIATKYFEINHPEEKDLQKNNYREIRGHRQINKQVAFMLDLLDLYLANGQITAKDLVTLLSDSDNEYVIASTEEIKNLYSIGEFEIIYKLSYLLGELIAEYIVENNTYQESINILNDMNEMITYDRIENIFKYLDIDVKEIDKWFVKVDDKELSLLNKRGNYVN